MRCKAYASRETHLTSHIAGKTFEQMDGSPKLWRCESEFLNYTTDSCKKPDARAASDSEAAWLFNDFEFEAEFFAAEDG